MSNFRLRELVLLLSNVAQSKKYFWHAAALTLAADAILTQLIIRFVSCEF
jgi:hypothetical protein